MDTRGGAAGDTGFVGPQREAWGLKRVRFPEDGFPPAVEGGEKAVVEVGEIGGEIAGFEGIGFQVEQNAAAVVLKVGVENELMVSAADGEALFFERAGEPGIVFAGNAFEGVGGAGGEPAAVGVVEHVAGGRRGPVDQQWGE
jgi:hypothetical protein